ncbi:hypothetical protein B4U79_00657, partial [Dinothrombium tinctorium]
MYEQTWVNLNTQSALNFFDLTPTTSPTSIATDISPDSSFGLRQLIEDLICGVKKGNLHFFSIPWNNLSENRNEISAASPCTLAPSSNACIPSLPSEYITKFGETLRQNLIDSIEYSLPKIVSYFGYWPEIISESHSHLCNCRKLMMCFGVSQSLDTDCAPLLQVQKLMTSASFDKSLTKHAPIIVVGAEGVGKSTLLSQIFTYCAEWLPEDTDMVRIVRHIGHSPASSYTSELLRNLCLHITLVYGFEMRENINHELSSLSIWFQELLKLIETTANSLHLVIVLDDLHNLKSPQASTILGWMPWNLPPNVHLICSVSESEESILKLLKSRITSENFIRLTPITVSSNILSMIQSKLRDRQRILTTDQWTAVKNRIDSHDYLQHPHSPLYAHLLATCCLSKWHSSYKCDEESIPDDIEKIVNDTLEALESTFGVNIVAKISLYLTTIRYGLREVELQELIVSDDSLSKSCVGIWLTMKEQLSPLLKEYFLLGRLYIQWSNASIAHCVSRRYLSKGWKVRDVNSELANAFSLSFIEVSQSFQDECNRESKHLFDLIREMDELWFHLLMSGDIKKLKNSAILNIDFLMSAVKCASISYLRSIVELVRGQALDFEIELLYNVLKHAVQIVSRDAHQLANEILIWLKPFSAAVLTNHASSNSITNQQSSECSALDSLLKETYSWSNNASFPLLIPTNSWLHLPLSPQLSVITCPLPSLTRAVLTSDGQNLISSNGCSLHVLNLASKTLLKSFEGHRQTITCLDISHSGRLLITGSEDTSVGVWNIESNLGTLNCTLKHRLEHHVSGVLCVAITKSEKYVLSGSEIGAICVAKSSNGSLLTRLEHHRGMVTCMTVNAEDDIFASGSTDASVIIWSLEDFMVLNQIFLSKPVLHMDISLDSTFLMLSCDDNSVDIRALTTGSDVHLLKSHQSNAVITCVKFADDSCRAILGTGDGKLFVYETHSARLIQTLTGHQDMITSILTQKEDKYLITCGGNKIIIWNFYARKSLETYGTFLTGSTQQSSSVGTQQPQTNRNQTFTRPPSKKLKKVENHKEPITCLDVSRDGNFAVTGARDGLVKIWQLSTGETHTTLVGHSGAVTCVAFAPNGVFCVSGGEDQTLRIWGLTLGLVVSSFKEQNKIVTVSISGDSRRILSVDSQGIHKLWQADTGNQLIVVQKQNCKVKLFGNIVFSISGKNDNSVRFWSIYEPESEKVVSHTEPINCYTVTHDCQTIITGSQDMSLKVWEVSTGKITQVLVGHEESVSCVATAPFNPSMIISGSQDCNLIVWDMTTGSEMFTLSNHTANVIDVKLSLDGTVAVSASEDNFLIVWEVAVSGRMLTLIDMHHSFTSIGASLNLNQIVVQLTNNQILPIFKLHKNPAKEMVLDLPPGTPILTEDKFSSALRGLRPNVASLPKRSIGKAHLKREQSFDSFYWDHLNRGVSIDDFRKLSALSSPMGSREHLQTTGIIWDGSGFERERATNLNRQIRPTSKLAAAPKQKMLKKQQSMFAFFPEHAASTPGTQFRSQSPLVTSAAIDSSLAKVTMTKSSSPLTKQMHGKFEPSSRTQSLEEQEHSSPINSNETASNEAKNTTSRIETISNSR